ncbi:MAG: hypothetical protein JJT78_14920 [Leptospira sp.]|nr:hypothetical protein [Leptospira sp.]
MQLWGAGLSGNCRHGVLTYIRRRINNGKYGMNGFVILNGKNKRRIQGMKRILEIKVEAILME